MIPVNNFLRISKGNCERHKILSGFDTLFLADYCQWSHPVMYGKAKKE